MMRREWIDKKLAKTPKWHLDMLPLDPRDPAVLRAKELVSTQLPPRRRAA